VGTSALVASITLIFVYRHLTSEGEKYVTVSSRGYRPSLIDLQRAKYPLFGIVGLLSFILVVLRSSSSCTPLWFLIPCAKLESFGMMSWKHWLTVPERPCLPAILKNSIFLGIVGGNGWHHPLDPHCLYHRQGADRASGALNY